MIRTKWLNSGLAALALVSTGMSAQAANDKDLVPIKAELLTSGLMGSIGGAIGPDGALYVPEAALGQITRIDPKTGAKSAFATGLPETISVVGLGGAIDVVFAGDTAYALVSIVGPEDFGPPPPAGLSTGHNGIYRINGSGPPDLVADLGAYSLAHPPTAVFDYFLVGGVQYSFLVVDDGFLVADGHHNRVLHVTFDGAISDLKQFGNVVPTGMDLMRGQVYLAHEGAITGSPGAYEAIGEIVRFDPMNPSDDGVVASGISMAVDVESGPGNSLYAVSQGIWDPSLGHDYAGSPGIPGTGQLLRVNRDGSTTVLLDGLMLPTSLHFSGGIAYLVTLTGEVWKIRGLSGAGRSVHDR
jgi:hypothetical protein